MHIMIYKAMMDGPLMTVTYRGYHLQKKKQNASKNLAFRLERVQNHSHTYNIACRSTLEQWVVIFMAR